MILSFGATGSKINASLALLVCCHLISVASAQQDLTPPSGLAVPVDLYGNAQALHPERRSLDVYQNEFQRLALTGYETFQRTSQRGYGQPFALPSDRFMQSMAGRMRPNLAPLGVWKERPSPFGLQSREKRAAYSTYGGFGVRRRAYDPEDPEGLFARKRSLIAATGTIAPIERTKISAGRLGSYRYPTIRKSESGSLVPLPETLETPPVSDPVALSRYLTSGTQVLHDRAQAEGWAHFEAGDYRAAIRAFESACMLDENDAGARIGVVFGHFALGSFRAAYFALDSIHRREPNPFRYPVSMVSRFPEFAKRQQVRLTALSMAEGSEQGPEMRALAIYILWYMDARDDALRAARALSGLAPGGVLAKWPELMQSVLQQPPGGTPSDDAPR